MEEKTNTQTEKIGNTEKKLAKEITKTEAKVVEHKTAQKQAYKETKQEVKEKIKEGTGEDKKIEKKETKRIKKTEAVVHGKSLFISTKHAVAICNLIRGKNIDKAISIMEDAEKMKIAVPMRGEIPHRKGKIMSGRYPVKAIKEFVKLLKSLKANALMNELELEKYKIFCKANIASRPYRRFGKGRFKRTHVELKLIALGRRK